MSESADFTAAQSAGLQIPPLSPEDDNTTVVNHRSLRRPNASHPIGRDGHPEELKALALSIYAETGSVTTAANETGLPPTTVHTWVTRDPEIDAKLEALRRSIRENVAHKYAEVARRAAEELLDRVNNGDYHYDKQGNVTRRPIPGQQLAFISSIAADKHALLTGTLTKQRGEDQALAGLADKLVKALERRKGEVIDAEATYPQDSEPGLPKE